MTPFDRSIRSLLLFTSLQLCRRQQASVVKVRAAANRTAVAEGPQRSLGDLPLPSGEWTANIPVFGETVGYLKDHMAWCHER